MPSEERPGKKKAGDGEGGGGKVVKKQVSSSLPEVELQCGICHQDFELPRRFLRDDDFHFSKIPKLLDCLHTFCQSCIQDAIERVPSPACFTCPTCNRRQPIPDLASGTTALVHDYTVLRSLREREETKLEGGGDPDCDECVDETLATHRCLDCGGHSLCDFHKDSHERSRTFQGHRVFALEDYAAHVSSIASQKGLSKCTVHDGCNYEHYCQDCDQVICTDCRTLGHSVHSCVPIAEVAGRFRRKMDDAMNEMDKGLDGLKNTIDKIAGTITSVTENTEETEKAIRHAFTRIRKELDARERALLQLLDERQARKLESLGRKRVSLDQSLADLEDTFQVADRCMEVLHDSDFVLMAKLVWKKIQGVALSLKEVNAFDLSEEGKQVSFLSSIRERELLSQNAVKFGAIVEDGELDDDDERNGHGAKAASTPQAGSVQIEFLVVSAVRTHVINKKKPSSSDDVVVEVREVINNNSSTQTHAAAPSKSPSSPSNSKNSSSSSSSEGKKGKPPPAGPLLGRLVLSIPVETPSLKPYTQKQSFESIEKGGQVPPSLRIIKAVRIP